MATFMCGFKFKDRFSQTRQHGCGATRETPWPGACPVCGGWYKCTIFKEDKPATTAAASMADYRPPPRIPTHFAEVDRLFGRNTGPTGKPEGPAGMLPHFLYFIIGPSGSGKTTLCYEVAQSFSTGGCTKEGCEHKDHDKDAVTLIASGEMAEHLVKPYFYRLGVTSPNVHLIAEPEGLSVYDIIERAKDIKAKLIVIDSLATVHCDDVKADFGSAQQVDAIIQTLSGWKSKPSIFLIGHLNKTGEFAGTERTKHLIDGFFGFRVVKFRKNGDMEYVTNKAEFKRHFLREFAVEEGKYRGGGNDGSVLLEMDRETGRIKPCEKSNILYMPGDEERVERKGPRARIDLGLVTDDDDKDKE